MRGAGAAGGVTKAAQARDWYEAENYLTLGALSRLDKQYFYRSSGALAVSPS